jgi:anti-sigma-K factor RskA
VADERLASAQQAAMAAQAVATILASADARRFELTSRADPSPAVAQLLWSRSQGIALTASRLPAPPPGRAYQLWMLTRTTPASVGLVTPNESGPTSITFPWPAGLQRLVVGAMVTIEPAEGSRQPSGAPWLVSPTVAPAATPIPGPATAATPGAGS